MSGILSTASGIAPLPVRLDHLVVAANTLDDGEAWLAARFGRRLEAGGTHAGFGTHNRLLGLGPGHYLELIAPDPAQVARGTAPTLFGLADPEVAAAFADEPRLLHAVWRVLPPATLTTLRPRLAYEPGPAVAMSRESLRWTLTLPATPPHRPVGWLPTLIDWGASPPPATRLPDRGVRLERLVLAGPSFMIARFPAPLADATVEGFELRLENAVDDDGCSTMTADFRVDGERVTLHARLPRDGGS